MSENDQTNEIQKLKEERDQYQQAAMIAEANELSLHRQIASYKDEELKQLRGEVQMWRNRAQESAREVLEEDQEVSKPS